MSTMRTLEPAEIDGAIEDIIASLANFLGADSIKKRQNRSLFASM